jgi:hypothetical protein
MNAKRKHEHTLRTQIGQYGMVPLWLLERCHEPRAIQLYALLLAKWANRDGRCWPDRIKDIVPAMGCSVATVDRAIADLKDAGALKTTLRHRGDGAVVGMDFLLIQADPSLTATNDNKDQSGLPITNEKKDPNTLIATSDSKAEGLPITGDGQIVTGDSHIKEQPDPDNQIQERVSAESTPTPAPALSPQPPAPSPTLLDDYHAGFVAAFAKPPAIVPGKDAKLLKDLATHVGEATVRRMLVDRAGGRVSPGWFFRHPSRFIQSTGYSVGVFVSVFNELQLTEQPPKDAASTEAHLRLKQELRARGEAQRAEYEQQARMLLVNADPAVLARIRETVVTDLKSRFVGIEQRMAPERWTHTVKMAMTSLVVDTAFRERIRPVDVIATYVAKASAA